MSVELQKPIPDGHLELTFLDGKTITYPFAECKGYSTTNEGLIIQYVKGRRVIPWFNLRDYYVQYNSDAYGEAISLYQLTHGHEWSEPLDHDGRSCHYCEGCSLYEEIERTNG